MKALLQTLFISIISFFLSIYERILQCIKDNKYQVPVESAVNKWNSPILEKFRSEYDIVAQECYDILKKENGEHIPQELDIIEEVVKRAKEGGEENQIFKRLYDEIYTIPPWVDFDRIERGKNLVVRSSFPAGILVLTGSSLVQSYASANGTEVLIETGRLKDDVVKRIMETGYFLQMVITPESLMPGREGHKVVVQVRMLHCAVRSYLTSRPKAWDKKRLGEPINHEDLAGTLCLFDFVFAECKTKLGYTFTQEEKEDLHLLWRYVGYLLGVQEDILPKTYKESTDLAFAIFRHQCTPNENSLLLVRQLFDSINLSPFFLFLPNPFWHQLSRFLLEDETSNKLGINPYSEGWFLLVRFFRVIIRTQYFLHKFIPYLVEFEAAIKRPMWGLFMKMGLKGRSVDYKIKRY